MTEKLGVKIGTHNVLHNKATRELGSIVEGAGYDIFCLQEAGSELPDMIGELSLAGHTVMKNRGDRSVGLAIYSNPNKWNIARVRSLPLPRTRVSEFFGLNPRGNRLLEVRLSPKIEDETALVVTTGHGSNLLASKGGRVSQFVAGGKITNAAAREHGSPAVSLWDTNLPDLTEEEIKAIEEQTGLRYAGPQDDVPTYKEYPRIVERFSHSKKIFDRVMVTPDLIENATVEVLPSDSTSSDHIPVKVSI